MDVGIREDGEIMGSRMQKRYIFARKVFFSESISRDVGRSREVPKGVLKIWGAEIM